MDYLAADRWTQLRKVLRYVRLYGVRSTAIKVRSQVHASASKSKTGGEGEWTNPSSRKKDPVGSAAGIIGCGRFAYSVIAYHLRRSEGDVVRGVVDPTLGRAISLCKTFNGTYATTDVDRLLADESIRIVYIASNHASHAEYAVRVLDAGKAVHIEKPHAVTDDQLDRLLDAMSRNPSVPVFLGYNRPISSHGRRTIESLQSGTGPVTCAWFVAGHEIPSDHWYFSAVEGGRVLGNLCHWIDFSIHVVGMSRMFPCKLVASSQPTSANEFVLTMQCRDGSTVSIVFSAKGHLFEGVSETFLGHRADTLVQLVDFEWTRVRSGAGRRTVRTRLRDHGHRENVLRSYRSDIREAASREYVESSGRLSLAARHCLETGVSVVVPRSGRWTEVGAA